VGELKDMIVIAEPGFCRHHSGGGQQNSGHRDVTHFHGDC
jgi:hypothetical protein